MHPEIETTGFADRPGFDRAVRKAAAIAALIGGGFLLLMAGATFVSVLGRTLFNTPLYGNFEIVELCTGIAVFSFFPYTHAQQGNVAATFFTDSAPEVVKRGLDLIANFIFLGISILLFWRVFVGLSESWEGGEATMVLGLPEWVFYAPATLWLVLLVAVCAGTVATGFVRLLK